MIILSQIERLVNNFHQSFGDLGLDVTHYHDVRNLLEPTSFCRTGIEKYQELIREEPTRSRFFGETQVCFIPEDLGDPAKSWGFYTACSFISIDCFSFEEVKVIMEEFLLDLGLEIEILDNEGAKDGTLILYDVVWEGRTLGTLYEIGTLRGFELVAESLALCIGSKEGLEIPEQEVLSAAYETLKQQGLKPGNHGLGKGFRSLILRMISVGMEREDKIFEDELSRIQYKKKRMVDIKSQEPVRSTDSQWLIDTFGITQEDVKTIEAMNERERD